MKDDPNRPRRPSRRSRWATLLALVAMLLIGIAVGVRWHAAIEDCFGGAVARRVGGDPAQTQLWTCSMHPQVLQNRPGGCPICGMQLTPVKNSGLVSAAAGERAIKFWWDPMMNPPYIAAGPGKSPMGMDLLPVYEDQPAAGAVLTIDPAVVQNMGVRVTTVTEGPLRRTLRVVGSVREPESAQRDINLRVSGWIETLNADTEGMEVTQGDPLFELYSPDLTVTIQELIATRGEGLAGRLHESVVSKLLAWGLDAEQVEQLSRAERAPRTVTFRSPITGHVVEKLVVVGAAVHAGDRVLRLSDRSSVWLELQVHEADLPFVAAGQTVRATFQALPGRTFEGQATFVHPHLDEMTRTAMVRVVLDNRGHRLLQGMFGTATIEAELAARALLVPCEAVIDTGERQLAFVSAGGGHFEPRELRLGPSGDDGLVQVLAGLAAGESVVTSGQFLLDSESRLREAIAKQLPAGLLAPAPGHEH